MECLEQSRLQPEQLLYEDEQCIVLNKPTGLAIHRAQGHDDNLLWRVQDFLRLRSETFRVAPIHRLDIGTSGAVLFGKGHAAISLLGKDDYGRAGDQTLPGAGQWVHCSAGRIKLCCPGQGDAPRSLWLDFGLLTLPMSSPFLSWSWLPVDIIRYVINWQQPVGRLLVTHVIKAKSSTV